ncbi:MAG: hypothetical protein COB38_06085 [Gammaproteobacteria bacterium]|nr:MAG: hypothetical protein COB38_06085 [Gammaproteobacteria bacterium]
MTISLDFSKIKSLISDESLILTPNARTQQALYNGQIAKTKVGKVITAHKILSFTQWQNELWIELSFLKDLPKPISKQLLKSWIEDLIAKEPDWNLTNESGVANKVVEAFQNLIAWDLPLNDIKDENLSLEIFDSQMKLEVSCFIKWIEQYEKIAESKSVICSFEKLKYISNRLELLYRKNSDNVLSNKSLPKKMLLVGFNQFTPLEKKFFSRLQELDVEIEYYNYKKTVQKSNVIEFNSFDDEINYAARTAKQIVEAEGEGNVAVVVNQLSDNLTDVYAAFSQAFQPEENKPWVKLGKPLYNVSAGFSIADQSIVKAGSLLLNFRKGRVTLEELHFIKNTHYFPWNKQNSVTKYFLHKLCLKGRKEYKVKYILSEIEKFECGQQKCLELESDQSENKVTEHKTLSLSILRERIESLGNKPSKNDSIKNYQKNWKETLKLWQWGTRLDEVSINDTENKICNLYVELINETTEINNLFNTVNEKTALQYLNQLATKKSFQLPSDRSRVHVLGVLEATGLQFDHLILVGFNSVNWPVNNKPNPFLPSALQRELKMPGGSPEREYEYTKSLSDILINSSDDLLVTSSDENSDAKQTVSIFFSDLSLDDKCLDNDFSKQLDNSKYASSITNYEWISNSNFTVEKGRLHGGTSFLSRYASCPFSGFLAHYLKVTSFESVESGIDARQRGVWLHDTMQLIWEQLKTKQNLLALDDTELIKVIDEKLQSKLNEIKSILLLSANEAIILLEKEKLSLLIYEWMLIEKDRNDFLVKSLEKEVALKLQGINFTFRLDRVDLTGSGKLEIIDYKTGKVAVNDWFSVRPTEAQMPAYMLAFENDEISAIDYARVKKGEVAQVGLNFEVNSISKQESEYKESEFEDIVKFERSLNTNNEVEFKQSKLKEKSVNVGGKFDREELKLQWQKTLDRIAYGISEGFTPVSPKDVNQSCTYCEYRSICRIDERQPSPINLQIDDSIVFSSESNQ